MTHLADEDRARLDAIVSEQAIRAWVNTVLAIPDTAAAFRDLALTFGALGPTILAPFATPEARAAKEG